MRNDGQYLGYKYLTACLHATSTMTSMPAPEWFVSPTLTARGRPMGSIQHAALGVPVHSAAAKGKPQRVVLKGCTKDCDAQIRKLIALCVQYNNRSLFGLSMAPSWLIFGLFLAWLDMAWLGLTWLDMA